MSDTSTINSIPTSQGMSSSRKIGLLTMMATCIGMVIVQGAMISAMQGIGLGGMGFIFAMLAALIIAQFNAMSFSELSLIFRRKEHWRLTHKKPLVIFLPSFRCLQAMSSSLPWPCPSNYS